MNPAMEPSEPKNPNNVFPFISSHEQARDADLHSLLDEIKLALHHLLDTGEETIIDLSNFPCNETCELSLKRILGNGEVSASLNIFGCDSIHETEIHGVWWVYHLNNEGAILTKSLYISFVPSIFPAQREDVEYGITLLSRRQ
jgi:hydrogenase-1 operon protein HyaF